MWPAYTNASASGTVSLTADLFRRHLHIRRAQWRPQRTNGNVTGCELQRCNCCATFSPSMAAASLFQQPSYLWTLKSHVHVLSGGKKSGCGLREQQRVLTYFILGSEKLLKCAALSPLLRITAASLFWLILNVKVGTAVSWIVKLKPTVVRLFDDEQTILSEEMRMMIAWTCLSFHWKSLIMMLWQKLN